MRSTSTTTTARAGLSRIFVTLTRGEAAALGRLPHDGDLEAIQALAKISTALEHAIADATNAEPSASTEPPLRAKHYRPSTAQPLRMAKTVSVDTAAAAPERLRMAKAALPATVLGRAPAPRRERDYVPYRDEVDGVYT